MAPPGTSQSSRGIYSPEREAHTQGSAESSSLPCFAGVVPAEGSYGRVTRTHSHVARTHSELGTGFCSCPTRGPRAPAAAWAVKRSPVHVPLPPLPQGRKLSESGSPAVTPSPFLALDIHLEDPPTDPEGDGGTDRRYSWDGLLNLLGLSFLICKMGRQHHTGAETAATPHRREHLKAGRGVQRGSCSADRGSEGSGIHRVEQVPLLQDFIGPLKLRTWLGVETKWA